MWQRSQAGPMIRLAKAALFGWTALVGRMTVAQNYIGTVVTQSYCSYSVKSATSQTTSVQPNSALSGFFRLCSLENATTWTARMHSFHRTMAHLTWTLCSFFKKTTNRWGTVIASLLPCGKMATWGPFSFQFFLQYLSHRIFRYMYKILNVVKRNN